LREMMDAGRFRKDLFYRLSVMGINLPPLRSRSGDVPLLVKFFAQQISKHLGINCPDISPESMMLFNTHNWPGNVRELQNTVEQALVLSEGHVVGIEHLPAYLISSSQQIEDGEFSNLSLKDARQKFEKKYLEKVLEQANGVVADAARLAGMNRQHFYQKMKQLEISRE